MCRNDANIEKQGAWIAKKKRLNFSNFETLKVEKKIVYPRVGYELADKLKGDKDVFRGFILFLVAVTAIYHINLSNVELSVHT